MLSLTDFKRTLSTRGEARWDETYPVELFWTFALSARPHEIWPHLSDTSRFNRELGLSPRAEQEDAAGRVTVTTRMIGFAQAWIEEPWQWVKEHTIVSRRRYQRGLARGVYAVFHIEDVSETESRVYIYFGWQPSHRAWLWFLKATAPLLKSKFAAAFRKIETQIHRSRVTARPQPLAAQPAPLTAENGRRLAAIRAELQTRGLQPGLLDALIKYILECDDLDVEPLRLKPIARELKVDLRPLIATALHATRAGLLKLSWDVICPHCRGSRASVEHLGEIPAEANCAVCAVTFDTAGADSIEVKFHVHPAIRRPPELLFCAAEPAKKAHIFVQQKLAPGAQVTVLAPTLPGLYRWRAHGLATSQLLAVSRDVRPELTLVDHVLTGQRPEYSLRAAPGSPITVTNASEDTRLFVLEDCHWNDNALKPSDVLAVPEFRDLFAEEHLNSTVKLFLGEQTILFTDIVGSTRFYNEVGDAKAFAEVRAHFQELYQEIAAQNGVVVKTIGDAVMAAFASPAEALRAGERIQGRFHPGRSDTRIRLRMSLHFGPVIAVQLNTGLDYFGNTVNFAAKIQTCAGAGEIAISREAYRACHDSLRAGARVVTRQHNRDTDRPTEVLVLCVHAQMQAAA